MKLSYVFHNFISQLRNFQLWKIINLLKKGFQKMKKLFCSMRSFLTRHNNDKYKIYRGFAGRSCLLKRQPICIVIYNKEPTSLIQILHCFISFTSWIENYRKYIAAELPKHNKCSPNDAQSGLSWSKFRRDT